MKQKNVDQSAKYNESTGCSNAPFYCFILQNYQKSILMSNDNFSVEEWIMDNFPYALHNNPEAEYSKEELNAAKRCFDKKDIERFDEDIREALFTAVAMLIRSITNYKEDVSIVSAKDKSESNLFNVMQAFLDGNITEVVFRGLTNEKIVLNSKDVAVVKDMFLYYYATGKIKNPDNYGNAIEKMQTIKKKAKTERKHSTIYRYELAATIDKTLSAIAPGNNHKIIGYILNETEMIETPYTGSRDNGTIQTLINRGNGQID